MVLSWYALLNHFSFSFFLQPSLSVPLGSVFTSIPMWAIIISHFANNWGFYTLLTNLPNYLKNVLKFDISQVGHIFILCHGQVQWRSHWGGQGGAECHPWQRKNCQKSGKKSGKSERKGKNREISFIFPSWQLGLATLLVRWNVCDLKLHWNIVMNNLKGCWHLISATVIVPCIAVINNR